MSILRHIRNQRLQKNLNLIPVLIQIHLRRPLRHLHQNWKRMPAINKQCILLLFIGHTLTFVPYVLANGFHDWIYGNADWFLSPSFHYPRARYWYFKDTADNVLFIIIFFLLAKVSAKFSDILFVVFVIFLGYHIIDAVLYWVDFNTQFWLYVDVFWTAIFLINGGVFPYKPEKFARIKSLF